ncbi:MAG: hypothetical protein HY999_05450 [Nitrospinae bacterium]|nr:hypothetical protein [Nitrospinota bacterium]
MIKDMLTYFKDTFDPEISATVPLGQLEPSEDKKVDVLIALMNTSKFNILSWSERAYKASTWSVGIILAIVGYFFLYGNNMPYKGRIILTLGTILFGLLTQLYLSAAKRAHFGNGYVLVKCESALRLCEKGTYFKDTEFFGYSGQYLPSKSLKVLRIFHASVLAFSVFILLVIDPIVKQ